jgi:hypothetical protein
VEELQHAMKKSDIISALDIFETIIPTGGMHPNPFPGTLSLFDKAGEALSEAHVCATNRFKRYFGQAYDIQDLQWSQELLENSCEEDLRIRVLEHMRNFPDVKKGGALYYYQMIKLIQTDVERGACGLIDQLETFTLKLLSGEIFFVACSLIKGVLNKLESIGRVPPDIDLTILKIMQTSTLEVFNSFFQTIVHCNDAGLGVRKTVDKILILAETHYKRHLEPGHVHPWKGTGRVGKSTFITKAEVAIELQANAAAAELEKRVAEQPRWNPVGNGNNRTGRRQRGGGANNWKRAESSTKAVEGVNWYWCRTCKYWNLSHTTVQHVSRPPPVVPQANVVVDNNATVVSNAGSLSNKTPAIVTDNQFEANTKGRASFYSNVLHKMKIGD